MDAKYLSPTAIINSNHPSVKAYAAAVEGGTGSDAVVKAVALYNAVRDDIRYDPYSPFYLPEHYHADQVLERGRGYCVGKASLLCALGRACGIPTRVGFATVKNHMATRQLIEFLGSDLFVYHGYVEFYLLGKWVKATPAFNAELCRKHHVTPLAFNGLEDSIFHAYNQKQKKFMEYVAFHGVYADIPVKTIVAAWKKAYGESRVEGWIRRFEQSRGKSTRRFENEDVLPT